MNINPFAYWWQLWQRRRERIGKANQLPELSEQEKLRADIFLNATTINIGDKPHLYIFAHEGRVLTPAELHSIGSNKPSEGD